MKRRDYILIGTALALTWLVVFLVTRAVINRDDTDSISIPTVRAIRTDIPELIAGQPTPTLVESVVLLPTATPRFTLSPIEIQAPDGTTLPPLRPTVDPLNSGGGYPIRLAIPELGILAAVVVVQTDENFVIVTPQDEVGYYALTPKIGAGGNSVMIGHVAQGRVFNRLLDANIGQIIRITDENYEEYYYQIEQIVQVPYESGTAEDHQLGFDYIYDNSVERITLVTCYPEDQWTHRFVVRAVPIPADVAISYLSTQTPPR
jgi:LPXTG-site transpeptidase (sortase) family protein